MKEFLKSKTFYVFGPGVLLILVSIVVFLFSGIRHMYQMNQVTDAQAAAVVSENDAAIEEAQGVSSQTPETSELNPLGVDAARKKSDDDMMADLIGYAVTWSDSKEYENSRKHLLEKYPWIQQDSSFLTSFFPDVDSFIIHDSDGNEVSNLLDDGRNMTFVSFYSYVTNVQDDVYSYVAEVVTQSTGVYGGGSATGKILLTYSVDGAGQAPDLTAYTVSG